MTTALIASLLIGIAFAESLDDAAGRLSLYDKLGWSVSMQNTVLYILYFLLAVLAYPVISPLVA